MNNYGKEIFKTDMYIPSVGPDGMVYTWVSKELANEAVEKGYMNGPEDESSD